MVANVAMTSMPHSPPCPQTVASAITSAASSKKRSGNDVVICRYVHQIDRLSLCSTTATSKLNRARFFKLSKPSSRNGLCRASSASLDAFSDEEFSKRIEELAMKFQLSDDNSNADESKELPDSQPESPLNSFQIEDCNEIRRINSNASSSSSSNMESVDPQWLEIYKEPPTWPMLEGEIVIERKANSLDHPFSLRLIRRKKQSQCDEEELGFGESASCSVKKAISSLVFIIRELHSYTLQLRELLFYEDLQDILVRVQQEMHASFVWLFQQVFSHTPTFMVYVMILLANFTVHSMASNAAITISPESATADTMEAVSTLDLSNMSSKKFDSSAVKSFSVSAPGSSKKTYVGGNDGGGGKAKPVASWTDGDGRSDQSRDLHSTIVPDDSANQFSPLTARKDESVSGQEREVRLWNALVNEASRMQAETRGDSLDSNTIQKFVSPVTAKMETDVEYPEYVRTELLYRTALVQEPNNPLLLANFAQFLYLVAHNYDRAEEHFKAATSIEPKDAEACNKYAYFLWHVKEDLWAAEETYLEAISADPGNSYYQANYAQFLWSTGGEDTCYPLDAPEDESACEA